MTNEEEWARTHSSDCGSINSTGIRSASIAVLAVTTTEPIIVPRTWTKVSISVLNRKAANVVITEKAKSERCWPTKFCWWWPASKVSV